MLRRRMLVLQLILSMLPILSLSTSIDFVSVRNVNLKPSDASCPFSTMGANQRWWRSLLVHPIDMESKKAWQECTECAKMALKWIPL